MTNSTGLAALSLQAKVFINGIEVAADEKALLYRDKPNDLAVENLPVAVTELRVGVVGDGNVALETVPKGAVAVIDGKAAWQVKSNQPISGLVTLVLYSPDTVRVQEIKCGVVASDLAAEIRQIDVADTQVPPGPTLYRGTPKKVSLRFNAGSPLQSPPVQLIATRHVGLQPADLTFTPLGNDEWSVTASQTGMFSFGATLSGMSDMTGPLCRVV